jgi:hypothetical protein
MNEVEKLWDIWEQLRDRYYAGEYSPKMKRLIELALDMAFVSLKECDRWCYSDIPHYAERCRQYLSDAEFWIERAKRYFAARSLDGLWCWEIKNIVATGETDG